MSTQSNTHAELAGDREIVVSRVFDAPREMVWEAMADPERVVRWWGPRGFTSTIEEMDFRPGGVWKHVMQGPDGTRYPNKSIFKEIVKHERIVYSHAGGREDGPGASFVATWTFEAVDAHRTRLTIRQVFPSPEMRDLVVREFGAVEGGRQTMQRLSEELVLSLDEFSITREFDAPRELVWRMWTDAEQMAAWWGPKGTTCSNCKLDLRPEGAFHYLMHAPNGFEMWGKFVYREVTPPLRLVFVSSFSDPQGGTTRHPASPTWPLEALNILTLVEQNGRTTLTLRVAPLDATAEERQTFKQGRAGMQFGLKATLDHLEEHLAPARGAARP